MRKLQVNAQIKRLTDNWLILIEASTI